MDDAFDIDELGDDSWTVTFDGAVQSYVNSSDPSELRFGFLRHVALVAKSLPRYPGRFLLLGGGGLTLPRYLAAVRPGSIQTVVEPNHELTAAVLRRLPLPAGHRVTVIASDGRTAVRSRPANSADLVVVDAFSRHRVPADLTTVEFFGDVGRVIGERGAFTMNLIDYPDGAYTRRVLAAMCRAGLDRPLVLTPAHRHFGNVTVLCGHGIVDTPDLRTAFTAADPGYRVRVLPDALDGDPLCDADSMASPLPPRETLGLAW